MGKFYQRPTKLRVSAINFAYLFQIKQEKSCDYCLINNIHEKSLR